MKKRFLQNDIFVFQNRFQESVSKRGQLVYDDEIESTVMHYEEGCGCEQSIFKVI